MALGEVPAGTDWDREGSASGYGIGGPWAALSLYAKKIAVASAPPVPRVVGKSVVPTKVEALLAKWPTKISTPTQTTSADGTITIPAVAFASKNRSASLTVMKSAGPVGAGEQLQHNGCSSPVSPLLCESFPDD